MNEIRFGGTFRAITGCEAYPFQCGLNQLLEAGESVVFRAPTGAGKTWAVTVPFLQSMLNGRPIADRLIYCLPLRSLATSLYRSVSDGVQRSGLFADISATGKDRDYRNKALHCSLQIGGEKNDPFFESDLVFTTIDQALSGYLMMPVSLPPRLDNIVAGGLIGSYLVFDEAHLLDYRGAFSTMVEMLERLRGLCRFAIMTATMSDEGIRRLAKRLGATAFTIQEEELRQLPSQRTKKRDWGWRDQPLDASAVAQRHDGGRSIAIVNTVSRAQQLFEDLRRIYADTIILFV